MASQDWKSRVEQEKQDLDVKLDKLTEFLKSEMTNVSTVQRELLHKQHEAMLAYSNILAERIVKWQSDTLGKLQSS